MTISVERVPHNGMLVVAAMINGYRVCRRYMGYTKREAVGMFKKEVKCT